jgi:hypothetical protein
MNQSFFLGQRKRVSYQSKKQKNVLLISTMHNRPEIEKETGLNKPEIVLNYNITKGDVDAMEQMTKAFSVQRKTTKVAVVLFF